MQNSIDKLVADMDNNNPLGLEPVFQFFLEVTNNNGPISPDDYEKRLVAFICGFVCAFEALGPIMEKTAQNHPQKFQNIYKNVINSFMD